MSPVVETRGLTKRFGAVAALDGVSVEFAGNTISGLLGRNGAGKTTLLRVLAAMELPTSGAVEVFGERPWENAGVLERTCLVRENPPWPDVTVRDVLRAAGLVYPGWDVRFAAELVDAFELPVRRRVRKLSHGMRSAVGIVVGLASRAPLTLFDEPCLGLDAAARQLFYDRMLADYTAHPRAIVISTHLIDEVADLLEDVVVIDRGRVLLHGSVEALRGGAVTASGPVDAVEAFVRDRAELHRERVGGLLRVTVTGAVDHPAPAGVKFEPVSLQQLVVRSSGPVSPHYPPVDAGTAPERLR